MNEQTSVGTRTATLSALATMPGFGNDFETEALPGALPRGQNSPQRCAYGLYAEQLSGTPFTAPRGENERTWCYRIRPSVRHTGRFSPIPMPLWKSGPHVVPEVQSLGQFRWDPLPMPGTPQTFVAAMRTMTTAGDVNTQAGMAIHAYAANADMTDEHFYSADSELLVIPQVGRLDIFTELGRMVLEPLEIALIPRGLVFRVALPDGEARGFVCENYGQKFTLPERGPIGANCLANSRDFRTPVAAFEDVDRPTRLVVKWCGGFYATELGHSPLDVVAWHGNYAPCKYDLRTYSPVGAILFDHPDPSIFSVLTAPSGVPGTSNVDFLIFPERWLVAEHSFRPPWYHKNIMSEFMANLHGQYDAKPQGFVPGGMSLHNMMLPHGPDADAFEKASAAELRPQKLTETMAFMLETRFPQHLTAFAAAEAPLQSDYLDCWDGLAKKFDGTPKGR